MIIQKMAMATCSDEKCRLMLTSDPDLMRLATEAKALLADRRQMESMQKKVLSDPTLMQAVIIQALAAESAVPMSAPK